MKFAAATIAIVAVGCGDEPVEPAAPDARDRVQPTALRPGPCESQGGGDFPRSCTMTYGEGDRLTGIACEFVVEVGGGGTCDMEEQWTMGYVAGEPIGISRTTQECDTALFLYDAYDFDEPITGWQRASRAFFRAETTATYEPELVLTRHPFEHQISLVLAGRDALVATHHELENGGDPTVTDHTFTYDGPPHQGVRTRTRDDGLTMTFEYDAQGRLIAASEDEGVPARTYEYDGDRLIRDGAITYQHDEFGNLVRRIDGDTGVNTVYDYHCWE
jgi:YD repeat-containing protein